MADGPAGFGKRALQARLNLAARQGRTVSQTEIGKLMGVSGVSVGRWESGEKEPDLETIVALAQVLQCDVAWLAFGIDPDDGYDETPRPPVTPTTKKAADEGDLGRRRRRGGS